MERLSKPNNYSRLEQARVLITCSKFGCIWKKWEIARTGELFLVQYYYQFSSTWVHRTIFDPAARFVCNAIGQTQIFSVRTTCFAANPRLRDRDLPNDGYVMQCKRLQSYAAVQHAYSSLLSGSIFRVLSTTSTSTWALAGQLLARIQWASGVRCITYHC